MIRFPHFRPPFALICIGLLPLLSHAQSASRKQIVLLRLEPRELSWQHDGFDIRSRKDSIEVRSGERFISAFRIQGGRVAGPLYREYGLDGKLRRVDSLIINIYGDNQDYPGPYRGQALWSRLYYPDGIEESVRYYKKNAQDSLQLTRYTDGVLHQKTWYNRGGNDSLTYTWNPEGILVRTQNWGNVREFSPSGILVYQRAYVSIDGYRVLSEKRYDPTGILRAEEYRYNDIPCHTWRYYTPEGVLQKTEKKKAMADIAAPEGFGVIEAPAKIFTIAEQSPDFIGGSEALENYLNQKLITLPRKALVLLADTCMVNFSVDAYGKAQFNSMEPSDNVELYQAMRSAVAQMPRWIPGKRSGRTITVTFVMTLVLKR